MKKVALIVFVLLQISPGLQAQSGSQQIVLHTTSDYSCSSVNFPTISLLNSQKYPNDELTDYSWTKDGSFQSIGTSIVANGPGEYCLTIIDSTNQISNTKCITILPYRCDTGIDAFYRFVQSVPLLSPYNVAVYPASSTLDSCYTNEWFVLEKNPLLGNTYQQVYYSTMDSGLVSFGFEFGKFYKIKHVVTGPCGSAELTWPIFQSSSEGEGETEVILIQKAYTNDDFKLYPNPTTGKINISVKYVYNTYLVVNIHGQTVLEGNYTNSIDLSELINGIYTVVLLDNENMIHQQKIVKH